MSSIPGRDAADDPQSPPGVRAMRASDQDRTEAVMALTDHVTDGRLDSDEFEARVSAAYAATYLHELDPLFVDLPYAARRPVVPAPAGATGRRGRGSRFGGGRVAFAPIVVLAAVVAVAILTGHVWLLIPVAWFAIMAPHRRRWREHAIAARTQHHRPERLDHR